jgi:hypothetical protein
LAAPAPNLDLLQHVENLRVVRIATPVEGEAQGVKAGVAGQNLQELHAAEGIVGEVEGVEQQHVGDALACVDQIVTQVHDANLKIRAQALQFGGEGGRGGQGQTREKEWWCEGGDFEIHKLIVTGIKFLEVFATI